MMEIERIAAFALDGAGGNPAGVVVGPMPMAEDMLRIAGEVGYSETVFAERAMGFARGISHRAARFRFAAMRR